MLEPPAERQVYIAVLGQVIRQLRAAKQMSQEKLAGAAVLSKSALSRFELGQSTPDLEEASRIAVALSTNLAELARLVDAAVARAFSIGREGRANGAAQAGLAMMAAAEVTQATCEAESDGKRPRRQYWRGRVVAGR